MATSYTSLLGFALPVTGELQGTWGDTVNNSITQLAEDSIAGVATASVAAGNWTLSTTGSGATNEARKAILIPTGSPGVSRNIICPSTSKAYIVVNQSNAAVVVKGAATSGVPVPAGMTMLVAWNGSDFVQVSPVSVDASGNLGIGTSSPGAKLDVRGNATFTGNTTARQTADFTNTGGQLYVGSESSAGGAVFTGSSAYAGIIGTNTNTALQLATNGAVKATLDSSGNLGLGVTPSAWNTNFKALQMGYAAFLADNNNGRAEVLNNAYASGTSTYNYINSLGATRYSQQLGSHIWFTAPSGTAGNAITFTQAATIDASGNLLITSTAGLGYGTGSGGTVTQATSKSTAVTLNKPTGRITMDSASLAANTTVSFVFNNSVASANDLMVVQIVSGIASNGNYLLWVEGTGSAVTVNLRNISAGALAEAVIFQYSILKGATS